MSNSHFTSHNDILAIQKDMLRVERLRVFTLKGKIDTSEIYGMSIEQEMRNEFEANINQITL